MTESRHGSAARLRLTGEAKLVGGWRQVAAAHRSPASRSSSWWRWRYGFARPTGSTSRSTRSRSPRCPPSFDGTRIAFVTDIHRGLFFSQDRVRSLVERVNALDADLVVLGGDYVYAGHRLRGVVLRGTRALKAPLGVLRRARQPRLRRPPERRGTDRMP